MLPWQHLITMIIDKILKMIVKGAKLKSESFFLIFPGVLESSRKNLGGADSTPPPLPQGMDRVKQSALCKGQFKRSCCIHVRKTAYQLTKISHTEF